MIFADDGARCDLDSSNQVNDLTILSCDNNAHQLAAGVEESQGPKAESKADCVYEDAHGSIALLETEVITEAACLIREEFDGGALADAS